MRIFVFSLFTVLLMTIPMTSACSAPPPAETAPQFVAATASPPPPTRTPSPAPTVSVPTSTVTTDASPTTTTTATRRPTATITPTPQTHEVEPGDTLFSIAIEYDTTVETLLEANNINEEDFLQIGQRLIIPPPPQADALSDVVVTTTPLSQTTATATNLITAETKLITTTETSSPDTVTLPAAPSPAVNLGPIPAISHGANINPLTGLPVSDVSTLQRRPILVRIGNDVGARRSQAGFNQADVVYEEIAEWWVTRFTAIFLSETPNVVAPIRSARLINVLLAPQYSGALVHSGGSDPVRWEISQAPFVNLDEFYHPSPYFYRPNQGWQTRLAVDVAAVRNYLVSQNMEAAVSLSGFLFDDTPPAGENGNSIYIPYPRSTSFTEWRYEATSGKYLRWIAGSPLMDANTGQQVSASNVIVYFAEHQATDIVEDSNGATAIRMLINGRGPAMFFRDGKVNSGFWQTDGTRPPYFTLADGSAYALKPGNSWIQIVPLYFTIGIDDPDAAGSR